MAASFFTLCAISHGQFRLSRRNIVSYVLKHGDRFKVCTDDSSGDNYTYLLIPQDRYRMSWVIVLSAKAIASQRQVKQLVFRRIKSVEVLSE